MHGVNSAQATNEIIGPMDDFTMVMYFVMILTVFSVCFFLKVISQQVTSNKKADDEKPSDNHYVLHYETLV